MLKGSQTETAQFGGPQKTHPNNEVQAKPPDLSILKSKADSIGPYMNSLPFRYCTRVSYGCGSKLNSIRKTHVLVNVYTFQGTPFWNTKVLSHSYMGRQNNWSPLVLTWVPLSTEEGFVVLKQPCWYCTRDLYMEVYILPLISGTRSLQSMQGTRLKLRPANLQLI